MQLRFITLVGVLVAPFILSGCQSTAGPEATDPQYGSVENWPSTQVRRSLGRGE